MEVLYIAKIQGPHYFHNVLPSYPSNNRILKKLDRILIFRYFRKANPLIEHQKIKQFLACKILGCQLWGCCFQYSNGIIHQTVFGTIFSDRMSLPLHHFLAKNWVSSTKILHTLFLIGVLMYYTENHIIIEVS